MRTQMKFIDVLPTLLALLASAAVGQAPSTECGTVLTPEHAEVVLELQRRGFYELPADFDAERFAPRVPVTLHVVRRSDGTGGIGSATAIAHFNESLTYWQDMRIDLFQSGSVRFINDSGLFNIDNEVELGLLWSTDVVGDTVNVYFVNGITLAGGDACGVGSLAGLPLFQGVAVDIDCTDVTANSTLAHEIGHYFDLLHTHDTAAGIECPNGSNCSTSGDLVCDTPADPDLSADGQMNAQCAYVGTSTRCGQPFNPDTRNVMSYATPRTCRDHFTTGQRNRALATLANLRPNLIEAGNPSVIWVDFGAGSVLPNGDFTNPYTSLEDGLDNAPSGGRLVMKAGSSSVTGTFSDPILLDAFRGSAVLGQ